MTAARIRFTNLLREADSAFLAGDMPRVQVLLAEAMTLVAFERLLLEDQVAS